MRVISEKRLKEYWKRHPDTRGWLENWHRVVCAAEWKNLAELRVAFPHADPVKVKSDKIVTVFNVRGNNHRMIAAIDYAKGRIYVLKLMTRATYDRNAWKKAL